MIYRSTPFLTNSSMFFDILINLFGFAMPFPICIHEKLPVVAMAFLGYIPPALAMITAIFYSLWYVRCMWLKLCVGGVLFHSPPSLLLSYHFTMQRPLCGVTIYNIISANKIKMLSHRENYGFHGFYFLLLFVFKYIMDTSFLFISCSGVNGESVSLLNVTITTTISD